MQPRPIVGREWHLSVLRDAFATVKDGGSRLVMVSGTAGIGKTSLVEAAMRECSRDEFVTNFYADTPGNAVRALPAVIRGLMQSEEIDDLLEAGRFRDGVSPSTEIREAVRAGLFQRALDAVGRACREKPHIFIFEDVHDIDGPSESLIRYLCRGLTRSRAAIVLTLRPSISQRNPHAEHLLDELRGLSTAVEISLDPLTQSDVVALVSMTLPPAASELDSEWLHDRTGGNPFYLRAFLDRWAAGSDEMRPNLREIPDSVLHFVRRQLARLDDSVHELIRVAAISGPQVGYRLLTRCCSDPETVLDQIDAAKEARVLTDSSPGVLSFVHALVRESVLLSLSTQDRVEMHLKVARILEEEDSSSRSSAAIAQHYHGAIPVVGVEPFIHHAILAARSSNETLSFEDAIDVAELALDLPLGNVEEAELRLQRGQARLALRDTEGAVEDLRRVFEIFRQLGRPASALDAAKIPLVVYPVTPAVADLAASALEIAADDRDVARLSVPYALASYHADFDGEKSIGRLRRSIAVLEEDNDSVHLANAKVALAQVLFCESRMNESLALCSEVIDSRNSIRPVSRVRALCLAATNELRNGSVAHALRHAERALRLAERINTPRFGPPQWQRSSSSTSFARSSPNRSRSAIGSSPFRIAQATTGRQRCARQSSSISSRLPASSSRGFSRPPTSGRTGRIRSRRCSSLMLGCVPQMRGFSGGHRESPPSNSSPSRRPFIDARHGTRLWCAASGSARSRASPTLRRESACRMASSSGSTRR